MKKLDVRTQGIRGGQWVNNTHGFVNIRDNEEGLKICVDAYEGRGVTYKSREKCQIHITFPDKTTWQGNIEELQQAINNNRLGYGKGEIKNE